MSTSISLAFGVGMLATITPGGIPFALAAVGLGAIAAEPGERPLRALSVAIAHGVVAGAVFAATFFAAAFAESLGLEVSDPVPVPALIFSVALMILGIGLAVSPAHHQRLRSAQAPAVFGLVYGIVSLPGALPLLQGMATQTDKSRGAAGVLGVAFLFCAGAIAALIAISLLATLVSMAIRRLGGAGTVLAGGLVAGAGLVATAYWMPTVPDDVGDRGGGLSERLADSSGAVGEFIANYELGFALLLLVAAIAAFAAALQPRS